MANAVSRKINKKRHWNAWSGSLVEIRRFADIISDLREARIAEVQAAYDHETAEMVGAAEESKKDEIRVERAQIRERIPDAYIIITTFIDGNDTVSGPAMVVLDEVDRRTVEAVYFELAGKHHTAITVKFSRKGELFFEPGGVSLEVDSTSQGWGRQAFAQISEEVEKGVPRWHWVHNRFGRTFISATAGLMIIGSIALGAHGKSPWNSIALLSGLLAAVLFQTEKIRAWFFPRFEIRGEGPSTGSRRIIYVFTLLVSVPLGIFVNVIS